MTDEPRRHIPGTTGPGADPDPALDFDVHSLTGAYAVDALDDVERARFEQHLAACADCAAEVRSFTETSARLGAAESMTPPAELRAAVLAEIGRTRQLSPGASPGRAASTGSRGSRWLAVAAASMLVAAAGLGGLALDATRTADRLERTTAAVTDVLSDPDRQLIDADFAGGHATVVVSGEEVVLLGEDVPAPPPDSVYVLWMLDAAGTPRSAGAIEQTGDGRVVTHTTGYRAGETMAVTVESDPDTTLPHGDIVMTTA